MALHVMGLPSVDAIVVWFGKVRESCEVEVGQRRTLPSVRRLLLLPERQSVRSLITLRHKAPQHTTHTSGQREKDTRCNCVASACIAVA